MNVVFTAVYVVKMQRMARRAIEGSGRDDDTQLKVPSAPTRYTCEIFFCIEIACCSHTLSPVLA